MDLRLKRQKYPSDHLAHTVWLDRSQVKHIICSIFCLTFYHFFCITWLRLLFLFCKANWIDDGENKRTHTTIQRTLSHHLPLWNVRFQNIGHSLFMFCFMFSWTYQTNCQLSWWVCKNMYNLIFLLRHCHAWWLCVWTFTLITKYYFSD